MTKRTAAAAIEPKDLLAGILQAAKDIYSIDKQKAEKDGVPVTVVGLAKFYVRRANARNNPAWRENYLKLLPSLKTDKEREDAWRNAFVDYLLAGVETLDGQPLPLGDAEKAQWKATFNELPDLFTILMDEAERLSNFTSAQKEAEEKN